MTVGLTSDDHAAVTARCKAIIARREKVEALRLEPLSAADVEKRISALRTGLPSVKVPA